MIETALLALRRGKTKGHISLGMHVNHRVKLTLQIKTSTLPLRQKLSSSIELRDKADVYRSIEGGTFCRCGRHSLSKQEQIAEVVRGERESNYLHGGPGDIYIVADVILISLMTRTQPHSYEAVEFESEIFQSLPPNPR